ncbi:MAG: Glutamine-dependent synthetase [Pseudomonadota bacterium]|jgi:NAD+ synthase (glutamine-hydrolysing)
MTLQLCIAQLNFIVGDMPGNASKIINAAQHAYAQGARVVITPELALCGYAAEDLLLRPAFIDACDDALKTVARELAGLKGLHVVVGHPTGGGFQNKSVAITQRFNKATVLCEGREITTYAKQELPNYQVFDERRYFTPGQEACVFEVDGFKLGLLICEDAWFEAPALKAREAGAEALLVLNASPFHVGKGLEREVQMSERVKSCGLPLVYAHLVGGQDEVIFEGRSFAINQNAEVVARAPAFKEDFPLLKMTRSPGSNGIELTGQTMDPEGTWEEDLWHALVLGIRDYLGKNGFPGAILGLSGGIDSALVLALAVDALGADKIHAVMMPSPYTADISWIDSREMVRRIGVRYDEISIAPLFEGFKTALADQFKGLAEDTTEENIQARVRGTLLMAMSNKTGAIVLTTGNKSEMATGYCTLYGDMAGGFAVIKDVVKTQVFKLAEWRNQHDPYGTGSNPIPERIITRPPSAELRADQKDQDSLPPYEVLDAIVQRYMENDQGISALVAEGFDRADVEKVTRLIKLNEYKRRQSPVGIRVTHRSFGKDWRYPITNRFRA